VKALTQEQTEFAVGRLVRIVETRKFTQTQLEQLSGVNQSTISKILSSRHEPGIDRYTPSEDILTKLFRALGLKLSDILNESDLLPDEILGYLATPLTGLSDAADGELRRTVHVIQAIAAEPQFASPKFEIYWPGDHTHPKHNVDISANQVYITDRSRASTHDFIVLFCGAASYGVGQENEIATQAGVPAIRLMPAGISRMMSGSFVSAFDVRYTGSLEQQITFDRDQLRAAFSDIRKVYYRHRALYKGMNGDGFGARLRKLIDERCSGYEQFAGDLGVSLSYLHILMDEPLAVSNPSLRLLKRMALRLGERIAYLVGESEESDPVWVDSNASWRAWLNATAGVDAAMALQLRDDWRHEYASHHRSLLTNVSHRESPKRMSESDWDRRYQSQAAKAASGARSLF
jgi:transcriptional regulator with XRE-family HTH domain